MILTHRMVLLLLLIAWKLQSKEGSKRFANNVVPMIPVGGKCCWCFRSQRCTQPPHLRHPLHTWDVNDIHDHMIATLMRLMMMLDPMPMPVPMKTTRRRKARSSHCHRLNCSTFKMTIDDDLELIVLISFVFVQHEQTSETTLLIFWALNCHLPSLFWLKYGSLVCSIHLFR